MKVKLSIFVFILLFFVFIQSIFGQNYLQLKDFDGNTIAQFSLKSTDGTIIFRAKEGKIPFDKIAQYKDKKFELNFVNQLDYVLYSLKLYFPKVENGIRYYIRSGRISYKLLKRNPSNYFRLKRKDIGLDSKDIKEVELMEE